jgi:hypothetical protein
MLNSAARDAKHPRCDECKFSRVLPISDKDNPDRILVCHRYPPEVIIVPSVGRPGMQMRATSADNWCGEFKSKFSE